MADNPEAPDKGARTIHQRIDKVIAESGAITGIRKTRKQSQAGTRHGRYRKHSIFDFSEAIIEGRRGFEGWKFGIYRLEPTELDGRRIRTSKIGEMSNIRHTMADLEADINFTYGGGKYCVKVLDAAGRVIKSKIVHVGSWGLPKLKESDYLPGTAKPDPLPFLFKYSEHLAAYERMDEERRKAFLEAFGTLDGTTCRFPDPGGKCFGTFWRQPGA